LKNGPWIFLLIGAILLTCDLHAQTIQRELPPGLEIPVEAVPGPHFDPERATQAYIALLSPEQRALSDAYYTGRYWTELAGVALTVGISLFLIFTGIAQSLRDRIARKTSRSWVVSLGYAPIFIATLWILKLPLSIYVDFFREHAYNLSNQSFEGWVVDSIKELVLSIVFGSIFIAIVYAILRKVKEKAWIWASVAAIIMFSFGTAFVPVVLAPIFNNYQPIPEGPARDAIVSLARSNGVPTEHIDEFDASKQTTAISANVSGLGPTTRISLNDNLLKRTSLPEIRGVMAHEMGHFVLHHTQKIIISFGILLAFTFWITQTVTDFVISRKGVGLRISGREDIGALPLIYAVLIVVMYLTMPLRNTVIRQQEQEADAFGLNASREPQAFALTDIRLSTYRKIHPSALEEFWFYDHPSPYRRVLHSMTWLEENPETARLPDQPSSEIQGK
jgi:STE24 endopeptidase